jgi:Transposase DDE domain group 1
MRGWVRIRCGKNTGLAHLPSRDYAINQAWCTAVSLACDLLAWLRLLALSGDLARAEPKTLRYRLLHTAARIVRGQRRRRLKSPKPGPGPTTSTTPSPPSSPYHHPDQHQPTRQPQEPTRPVEPAPTRHDSRAPHPAHHPNKINKRVGRGFQPDD